MVKQVRQAVRPFARCIVLDQRPKNIQDSQIFINNIFSSVPKSKPDRICSFFAEAATFSINLNIPTVVLPAAVVPSRNSAGALQRRKALYFSIILIFHCSDGSPHNWAVKSASFDFRFPIRRLEKFYQVA